MMKTRLDLQQEPEAQTLMRGMQENSTRDDDDDDDSHDDNDHDEDDNDDDNNDDNGKNDEMMIWIYNIL